MLATARQTVRIQRNSETADFGDNWGVRLATKEEITRNMYKPKDKDMSDVKDQETAHHCRRGEAGLSCSSLIITNLVPCQDRRHDPYSKGTWTSSSDVRVKPQSPRRMGLTIDPSERDDEFGWDSTNGLGLDDWSVDADPAKSQAGRGKQGFDRDETSAGDVEEEL